MPLKLAQEIENMSKKRIKEYFVNKKCQTIKFYCL